MNPIGERISKNLKDIHPKPGDIGLANFGSSMSSIKNQKLYLSSQLTYEKTHIELKEWITNKDRLCE